MTASGPQQPGGRIATLEVAGATVADYVDGAGLDATLAPRPFLHPVRTLAGTVVTDERPPDHRWHLGVSVAVQDVSGVNFWGGRTYVRDQGYTSRDDHGVISHGRWQERRPDGFVQDLDWRGPDGRSRIHERRSVSAAPLPDVDGAWVLDFAFTLRNATDDELSLGSPATNGRPGAGYGGFFWRLPPAGSPVRVFTPAAEGEESVHGATADWLAASADHAGAPYTLVLAGADESTRADPWFVRVADYPGVGSSLAPVDALRLASGAAISRHLRVVVADGALSRDEVHALPA